MGSVRVISADRATVERAVTAHARRLRERYPAVRRIVWFGSWVTGVPTPGSDVDLCVVLGHAAEKFRDRIPALLPDAFPVGLDIFPYTEEEMERLRVTSPGWHATLTTGREL